MCYIINMPIFWIIFASIFGFYFLLLVVDLIFVFTFNSYTKRHGKSLILVLTAIYDNEKAIINLLNDYKIKVDDKTLLVYNKINLDNLKNIGSVPYQETKSELSYVRENLFAIIEENKEFKELEECKQIKDALDQLLLTYRSYVIMYNADVLGFNYWVRFLPWRYLFLLFKVKLKDICL